MPRAFEEGGGASRTHPFWANSIHVLQEATDTAETKTARDELPSLRWYEMARAFWDGERLLPFGRIRYSWSNEFARNGKSKKGCT